MPRSVLDLQLSKSLSKSDSNLVAVSPIQACCNYLSPEIFVIFFLFFIVVQSYLQPKLGDSIIFMK